MDIIPAFITAEPVSSDTGSCIFSTIKQTINKPEVNRSLKYLALLPLISLVSLTSCNRTNTASNEQAHLFSLLTPDRTHVTFTNTLTEGLNTNVLMYEYFYNGGGVAVGDLNGDGFQDLYFTGNMTDNKLYLNKRHMEFQDITDLAGVAGRPGPWKTGVTIADVNGDGKLDIFVCYSGKVRAEKRVPQLFINLGNDQDGVPHFKDMAAEFGLANPAFGTSAYFFDFDRDGDLDLLLVNHNPERISNLDEITINSLTNKPDPERGVRLLRNDNGHFHDVTKEAGIYNSALSYGLAAGIADINGDGWPDIYVSNDYNMPDRLYINNGNGTFTDRLQQSVGHTSFFSMGNDIADVNNDCRPDIMTLDMLPEDNKRQILLAGGDNYESFNLNLREGFYYQYMRNMLQINNGNGTFSEVGQMAGISNTDWSWAPLFADYDNDGWKDLFVTNGYTRDYTNLDFLKFMGDNLRDRRVMRQDLLDIVQKMPSSKVKSYFFRNNGNLTFDNVSNQWGITETSNSNGAAYVDLDNDGDIDLVVNNINQAAFIYENKSNEQSKNHFLEVKLKGKGMNTEGIGAKVFIYSAGKVQYQEQMPSRGFQSSVSPVLHFGLGKAKKADSVVVVWLSQLKQRLDDVKEDQQLAVDEKKATETDRKMPESLSAFAETKSPLNYRQEKNDINDFKRQPLMVNPMSFSGPCMTKGDVNGDGLEDIYVGGSDGKAGALYLQQKDHQFMQKSVPAFEADKACNDAAAVFFDANGDGNPDLYVASGGYGDLTSSDLHCQDRLYINDGKGNFVKSTGSLPKMLSSKGCVRVADVNGDGHPDLFVGGRVVPGRYPETPQSCILINDGKGHFTDETVSYNSELQHIGMVTDAAWVDLNGDHKPDLIIVGEWMPVTILINSGGKLVDQTSNYLDKKFAGWWNCLTVGDFNHDGHPDLIIGNLGLNSQCRASDNQPVEMYYKDFDGNGAIDPILCTYIQGKSYPYVTRDELLDQISMMRPRFPDYKSYADATLEDVFKPEELKGSKRLSANCLQTVALISDKTGKLHDINLPLSAQASPVFTINVMDYDHDGNDDLLLCGNINHTRIRFGKYDANYGVLLKGDGKGNFSEVPSLRSGFKLVGDVRCVLPVNDLLLFGINQGSIRAYKLHHK